MTNTSDTIGSTLLPTKAAEQTWDVLVIGAGPAGALAARQLARSGATVLLADKSSFPRTKVCGSCLNGAALATLTQVGLQDLPLGLNAVPLSRWRLHARGARAECRLPGGVSLSRAAFDAALVREAILAGAHFLAETKAVLEPECIDGLRRAVLSHGGHQVNVSARIVLVADGLAGGALASLPEFEPVVSSQSRVGAGAILNSTSEDYLPGCIYMATGRGGYVGLVRLEDGRLDVAAAFDLEALRVAGGPGQLAARVLSEVKLPPPDGLLDAAWRGTPALARRRRAAGERVFVLGDAACYLEPFTGEGIAWALASAVAVAPLSLEGVTNWRGALIAKWIATQRRIVVRRQRVCRLAGAILRRPLLASLVSRMLAIAPSVASPLIRAINRAPK